jgi:polyhydroxybutyrate depolymerase
MSVLTYFAVTAYRAAVRDAEGRGRAGARLSRAKTLLAAASGILVWGLVLAGCGGPTSPIEPSVGPIGSPPESVAAPTAPTTASPVAPSPAGTSAPKRQESIAIGDDERVVDLFIPSLPSGSTVPLLVLLHANGESPFVMEQESRIGQLAEREGVIVALPPALEHRWVVMVSPGDPITPSADADYVAGLIERLEHDMPVDPGRVFVAGFSMGAVLTERMACQHADLVAAVALNAGAPWSDECSPSRPLPILVMHGTADTTFRIALAGEVVTRWRELDGCSGTAITTQVSDVAISELNEDCADGTAVEFVRYTGSGHRWLANPDATDVLWQFFQAHART